MPMIVACPSCTSRLKVNENAIGRKVRCPKCGDAVPVTDPDDVPVSPKPAKRSEKPDQARTPRPKKPPEPEPEGYEPEESEPAPEERRPKKKKRKKKRRKERESTGVPKWAWWTVGVGCLALLLLIGAFLLIKEGHGPLVLIYAISVPISCVIMIVAMLLSSALGGGIYFGELGEVIVKSLCMVLVVNALFLIPVAGRYIGLLVLLIGSMILFDLDIWEARFFIGVNGLLNFGLSVLLFHVFLHAVTHPGLLDDSKELLSQPPPGVSLEEDKTIRDIEDKGGVCEPDPNDPDGSIVAISLENSQATDADLLTLKLVKKLKSLKLGPTQATEAGLAYLSQLTSLQTLDLSNTPVTDRGLTQLKQLKQLQLLNLTGTKVTEKGVQDLKKALPQLQIIRQNVPQNNMRRPTP